MKLAAAREVFRVVFAEQTVQFLGAPAQGFNEDILAKLHEHYFGTPYEAPEPKREVVLIDRERAEELASKRLAERRAAGKAPTPQAAE